VSVSQCICLREHISWNRWTDLHEIASADPLWPWVARSTSGGIAIRYVLPVLWMTSRFGRNGPYG